MTDVLILKNVPVKDGPGEHGKDIGFIYGQYGAFNCSVDYALEHDGWVPIINPPEWKDTGKRGWVKKTWCVEDKPGQTQLLVTVYNDGRPPTVKVVS